MRITSVIAGVVWPRRLLTVASGTPRMTSQEANLCRRSWKWKSISPASRPARSKACRMSGHRCPSASWNTPCLFSGCLVLQAPKRSLKAGLSCGASQWATRHHRCVSKVTVANSRCCIYGYKWIVICPMPIRVDVGPQGWSKSNSRSSRERLYTYSRT